MKPFKLDKNGIPILSRADIEERAELFLKFFDEKCLQHPKFSPLDTICTRLSKDHGVTFVLEADLGYSPEGYKYRGRFHIQSTTIFVDKSMPIGEPRFNFTLAHEIAHFVLHRRIDRSIIKEKEKEISDTSRQLILDQVQSDSPRDWLEYQANKFASSLLLPRFTVQQAVINKQKEMGITRRIGTIFHDNQPRNKKDYREIMDTLSDIYITSEAAIRIRLRELNILIESKLSNPYTNQGLAHVKGALFNVFEDMVKKYN